MKIKFTEKQQFTQWWLWIFLIPIATIPIVGIVKQVIIGTPFGNKPMSDVGLFVFAFFIFLFITFFKILSLKTVIDHQGIKMKY